jgi:hypothetical protein
MSTTTTGNSTIRCGGNKNSASERGIRCEKRDENIGTDRTKCQKEIDSIKKELEAVSQLYHKTYDERDKVVDEMHESSKAKQFVSGYEAMDLTVKAEIYKDKIEALEKKLEKVKIRCEEKNQNE